VIQEFVYKKSGTHNVGT